MDTVGVWSNTSALAERLEARLGQGRRFVRSSHPADFSDVELLVVAPDATGLAGLDVLRPRLALLPGLRSIDADRPPEDCLAQFLALYQERE